MGAHLVDMRPCGCFINILSFQKEIGFKDVKDMIQKELMKRKYDCTQTHTYEEFTMNGNEAKVVIELTITQDMQI